MANVYLHYKETPEHGWTNEERQFTRVPCVGEYVALSMSSIWVRVYAVVHCPFITEFEAEVYAIAPPNARLDAIQA